MRLYTDEEIAMILREAAQSADSPVQRLTSSSGFTLEQIKAAAAEAGLDPALVERAALRIAQQSSESFFERAAGGPIRHRHTVHLPVRTSDETSGRLLSAIRAAEGVPGEGRADSSGFSWYAKYGLSRLSVTAHEDSRGTRVQILVDRTGALFMTAYLSLFAVVMPIWMLIERVDSYPELLALAAIPAGVTAAARAFWKFSTRSIRDRIAVLVDAVRDSLRTSEDQGTVPDGRG